MKFTYSSGAQPLAGFTIKRGIGWGGFGEVYYAVSDAGKEVALKLVQRNLEIELRGVRQCLNLKHPNLLAIHDIRTDDRGDRWIVMEYVAGDSLEQALERAPDGLPEEQALFWFRGLAAGAGYLHDHGIVHRDLKPANIFCDEGVVKLGDYGLSKFLSCSRRSGQTESVGTVHYMAPEIANGRYGREIDVYALGVLLYEMLTGATPFEGESVGEVLMKHLTAEPDLSKLREPYRSVVARALVKDPQHRFADVRDMLALLPGSACDRPAPVFAATTAAAAGFAGRAVEGTGFAAYPAAADLEDAATRAAAAGDAAPSSPAAGSAGDEPVWRLVRDTFQQLNDQWTNAQLPPLVKVGVLLAGAVALMTSFGIWLPIVFLGFVAYGIYLVVRSLVLAANQPKTAPRPIVSAHESVPSAMASAAVEPVDVEVVAEPARRRHRWRRQSWEPKTPDPPKPLRQSLLELCGSMLLAAGIASVLAVVMMVLRRQPWDVGAMAQLLWLAMTGAIGAWCVMIPAKTWEGRSGDVWPRRFAMLAAGLVLGAVAFVLQEAMQVQLPYEMRTGAPWVQRTTPPEFHGISGVPRLPTYLAYFGFLFVILRWWRQAEPRRATRLSVWLVVCCLFWAWLLDRFWAFPQPWGVMTAAVVAITVQLASPWKGRRREEEA